MFDQWNKLNSMIRMSMRSLMLHKLRSLLTILGLVFGVASVIIMLSIAEGAGRDALRQIESLGINNVIVRSIKPTEDGRKERRGILEYGLNAHDITRIAETMETVETIAPFREFNYEARHLDQKMEVRLVGLEPDYAKTNRLELAQGRFINETDLFKAANVCVIGSEVAQKLFRYNSALNETVMVANKYRFRIVGVVAAKMSSAGVGSSLSSEDFNRDIYIPLSTDHKRIGEILFQQKEGEMKVEKVELSQLTVRVKKPTDVKKTAAAIKSLLLSTHEKEDFRVTVPLDLLEQRKATQRIFNFVLGSIAAISLLVGGIGIMNIMLATVSERTGEIGIRRALGAKQSDITFQFLVETLVLSASGALIGAVVGLSAPPIISFFSGRETALTFWGPCIAVTVALLTGLIFGIYPAKRAASLDPIEALRRL
jgi:putative ABC transport system permease protein